ncbi:RNA methyltransferase [Candidatus Chloroploca sp. Khr17]|uniref:RNA methyltransferase n=1 Tax=Candidatus Chloroploca sp. Khr17 TaxID=2496869 RepID=UPI00101D5DF0|nr:TrmH family RNA methyltransferase [Candidatus Chloroploca sp. Khr17]
MIIVLQRPQDVRNIGAVVRAMLNFGFAELRLVEPAPFVEADLLGIAHRSEAIVARIRYEADLAVALAEARFVVGTSERSHPGRVVRHDLRPFARELVVRNATAGPVALLFGPEDRGLDNEALDRCDCVLSLPTEPGYPSLNLAQAVMLILYELHMAGDAAVATPEIVREPATLAERERFAAVLSEVVAMVGFIKSGDGATTLRRLRNLIFRAQPERRELALLTALFREVSMALRRK